MDTNSTKETYIMRNLSLPTILLILTTISCYSSFFIKYAAADINSVSMNTDVEEIDSLIQKAKQLEHENRYDELLTIYLHLMNDNHLYDYAPPLSFIIGKIISISEQYPQAKKALMLRINELKNVIDKGYPKRRDVELYSEILIAMTGNKFEIEMYFGAKKNKNIDINLMNYIKILSWKEIIINGKYEEIIDLIPDRGQTIARIISDFMIFLDFEDINVRVISYYCNKIDSEKNLLTEACQKTDCKDILQKVNKWALMLKDYPAIKMIKNCSVLIDTLNSD